MIVNPIVFALIISFSRSNSLDDLLGEMNKREIKIMA